MKMTEQLSIEVNAKHNKTECSTPLIPSFILFQVQHDPRETWEDHGENLEKPGETLGRPREDLVLPGTKNQS